MSEIEIPFGAFDSELFYQEITIPDGFEAAIEDKKIILKRKESEDEKMVKFIKKQLYNIKKTITENYELDAKLTMAIEWLEKQGEQKTADKVEAKFKVGDTMRTLQEANDGYTDGMPVVVSIDNEYYHCTNELIAIKDQDDYEFPPINVKQKPIDMVEPKFNVGDWIVFNGLTLYVKEVVKGFYRTITINGIPNSYDWDIDNIARLWTIADANNGDVLSCDSKYGQEIGIVKKYIGKYGGCDKCFDTYCFVDWDGIFRVGEYMGSQNIHPATKEQRDTLEKAMADAGYTFNFEKKELKKIEDEEYNGEDYGIDSLFHAQRILEKTLGKVEGYQSDDGILEHKCAISAVKKLYEQKPAEWSEEDEIRLDRICKTLWKNRKGDTDEIFQQEQDVDWLKSLKDRVQPQSQPAWSEEDDAYKLFAISAVEDYYDEKNPLRKCLVDWLISLKDRVQPQPKQEWSEDDEHRAEDTIYFLDTAKKHYASTVELDACIDWLKSLKKRIGG